MPGVLLGLGLLLVVVFLDLPFRSLLRRDLNPTEMKWAKAISAWSELHFLLLAAVVAGLVAWATRHRHGMRLALVVALAATLSGVTGLALRNLTGRTRPCATVEQGWYGLRDGDRWLVGVYDYNSFPSGHVSAAAGFAAALWWRNRRSMWWIWAVPVVVGWARMKLDRHHLSDVMLGMLVGWVMTGVLFRGGYMSLERFFVDVWHRVRGLPAGGLVPPS